MTDLHRETIIQVAKATPAVAGTVATAVTLETWVAIVTIFYVVLQAGLLLPKYWKIWAAYRDRRKAGK